MGVRNSVVTVLSWLRKGYPQGVPQEDYVALLGILRRELEPSEIEYVAEQLALSGEVVSLERIRAELQSQTLQQASSQDIRRVSAALAAGGWPLAVVDVSNTREESEQQVSGRAHPIRRFVDWIRIGYPAGVPEQDHQPLLALLHHRLPDEQVDAICTALVVAGLIPADRVDVGVEVSRILDDVPRPGEVDRVLDRLRSAGWPVEDVT
ncbi:MAG: DUF3349 domain-containing protein [Actinomycetales bacterium]